MTFSAVCGDFQCCVRDDDRDDRCMMFTHAGFRSPSSSSLCSVCSWDPLPMSWPRCALTASSLFLPATLNARATFAGARQHPHARRHQGVCAVELNCFRFHIRLMCYMHSEKCLAQAPQPPHHHTPPRSPLLHPLTLPSRLSGVWPIPRRHLCGGPGRCERARVALQDQETRRDGRG